MNTIEQATRRMEQLRRAGVDVPWGAVGSESPARPAASPAPTSPPQPASAAAPVSAPAPDDAPTRRSRTVELRLDHLGQQGYLVPGRERSQLEEEFRIIKRPLLKNARGEGAAPVARGNLIMVTSALPGEGKTYTALNLAISLAMELDHTVLLVDADVVRPAILERLGLPPAKGLLDLLTTPELDMSEVLLKTNIPKLTVLPAGFGANSVNTTELLASAAMEQLLDELATTYSDRIVIFDAPPLLPSTESRVLATHLGQIVVVVEADHTPRASVQQAFATLEPCPVVLSVLNKSRAKKTNTAYGYYAV